MAENDAERGKAKQDWFLEHGSIQAELLKLKKEALRKKAERPNGKAAVPQTTDELRAPADAVKESMGQEGVDGTGPPKGEKEVVQPVETAPEPPKVERVDDIVKEVLTENKGEKAPKLPVGKIPTAPNLSEKIASVIQLENKLKRRKYEMEKTTRAKGGVNEESEVGPPDAALKGGPTASSDQGPENDRPSGPDQPTERQPEVTGAGLQLSGGQSPATPITVSDPSTSETGTDMELDIGRTHKVEEPPVAVPAPESGNGTSLDARPEVAPDPTVTEGISSLPQENGRVTAAEGTVDLGQGSNNLLTEEAPPYDHHEELSSNTIEPLKDEANHYRVENGRRAKEPADSEWLEVTRGPKTTSNKEEKAPSSPFGRILGLFRKKAK